jgi:hypothetical protein
MKRGWGKTWMKSRRREEGVDKILYITIHYDIAFIADKRAEEMVDRGSFSPTPHRLTPSKRLSHESRAPLVLSLCLT